jgi:hypothetical protein
MVSHMITVRQTQKIMMLPMGFVALSRTRRRRLARSLLCFSWFPTSCLSLQHLSDTFALNTAGRLRLEWLRRDHRSLAPHLSLNPLRVRTRRYPA